MAKDATIHGVTMQPNGLRGTVLTAAVVGGCMLVTGYLVGVLVDAPFTAEWFGAVGTWLGSVATIGAVVWAVRVFRHEQDLRRQEVADQAADRLALFEREERLQVAAARERDDRIRDEAALVTLDVRGGGGFGHQGAQVMTEFTATVINASEKLVIGAFVWVAGGVQSAHNNGIVYSLEQNDRSDVATIPPNSTHTWTFRNLHLTGIPGDQWSNKPLVAVAVCMEYQIDGRRWRRAGQGRPQRHDEAGV